MDVYVPCDSHKVIFSPPLKQLPLYNGLDSLLLGLCFHSVPLDGDVAVQGTHVRQSGLHAFFPKKFSPLIYSEIYWFRLVLAVYCYSHPVAQVGIRDLSERLFLFSLFTLQHGKTSRVPG